jgi:hypothetical protein
VEIWENYEEFGANPKTNFLYFKSEEAAHKLLVMEEECPRIPGAAGLR